MRFINLALPIISACPIFGFPITQGMNFAFEFSPEDFTYKFDVGGGSTGLEIHIELGDVSGLELSLFLYSDADDLNHSREYLNFGPPSPGPSGESSILIALPFPENPLNPTDRYGGLWQDFEGKLEIEVISGVSSITKLEVGTILEGKEYYSAVIPESRYTILTLSLFALLMVPFMRNRKRVEQVAGGGAVR